MLKIVWYWKNWKRILIAENSSFLNIFLFFYSRKIAYIVTHLYPREIWSLCCNISMIYWQNRTKIFSRSLMVKWQKSFSEKYEDNTPGKRGRPKEIDDQTVKTIDDVIREDRWRIEKILGISKSSIHRILSDNLGMHRVFPRWVPWLLKVEEITKENFVFERNS